MRGGLVAVSPDPGNLGLKQGNPFAQLAYRIGIEAFRRKQAGGIDLGPGEVIIHYLAESDRTALLSTRSEASAVRKWLGCNRGS